MSGRIELINVDVVAASLLAIPAKIREAVERKALNEANKLAIGRLRTNAPAETGALKNSFVYDIRKYKGGAVFAGIVGADNHYVGTVQRNKKGQKTFQRNRNATSHVRRPARYIHLVELGTRRGVPATHFREKTAAEIAPQVQKIFEDAIQEALR